MSVIEHLEKIKDQLEKKGHIFFYIKQGKEYKLFHISKRRKDQKKEIEAKLFKLKRAPKYILRASIRVNISYINNSPGDSKPQNGPIFVKASVYYVDNKCVNFSVADDHRVQIIWYTKDELKNKRFSMKDVKKILNAVYKRKIELNPFADITFSLI
jgi:hypothetical protein